MTVGDIAHHSDAEPAQRLQATGVGDIVHGDLAAARIAARQKGLVTVEQLRAVGLGRGAIARRVANGRLHRVFRGVYLLGHAVLPQYALELGATLACGDGAALSHRSGTCHHSMIEDAGSLIDVSVPTRSRRGHEGIRLHRAAALELRDTGTRHGVPVTSPARTLLDFATVADSTRELERAYGEAIVQKLVTPRDLRDLIARTPGHRGIPLIAALIDTDPALTHKGVEEMLLALIRQARLPAPLVNRKLYGYEVDFHWPDHRLVVETDSARFHGVPAAVNRDRRKDGHLRSKRYDVPRYSYEQVAKEPMFVIAEIAAALEARRP